MNKPINSIIFINIRSLFARKRFIFSLIFIFCISYTTTSVFKDAVISNKWSVSTLEPFLFVSQSRLLFMSLVFLLFLDDIPIRSSWQQHMVYRLGYQKWLIYQYVHSFLVCLIILLLAFVFSTLFCIDVLDWNTDWSDNQRGNLTQSIFPEIIRKNFKLGEAFLIFSSLLATYWFMLGSITIFFSILNFPLLGYTLVTSLQLLPWITNTFISLEEPKWFPSTYANLFNLDFINYNRHIPYFIMLIYLGISLLFYILTIKFIKKSEFMYNFSTFLERRIS